MKMSPRMSASGRRGFVLLGVMLILVLLVTSLLITIKEASDNIRETGQAKFQDMVEGAAALAVSNVMDTLAVMDESDIESIDSQFDIFGSPDTAANFIPQFPYPPNGDFMNSMTVDVGIRRGQKTRPPAGEDVGAAYGYVLEVLVKVRLDQAMVGVEENVVVGIRVPQLYSYAD